MKIVSVLGVALTLPIIVLSATTYEVVVANAAKQQIYTPANLTIATGDSIHFTWAGGPHTVTQMGENGDPCTPLTGGVSTGKKNATSTARMTFITAGTRLFGCTVAKHCVNGMQMTVIIEDAPEDASSAAVGSASSVSTVSTPVASVTGVAVPTTIPTPVATSANTLPAAASPQSTPPAAGAPPTGVVHVVVVGQDGLSFAPANLTIAVGDTVQYSFVKNTHNVKQTATKDDCNPMIGGFASANLQTGGRFNQTFSSTGSFYYVCTYANPTHCSLGMKGLVNVLSASDAAAAAASATAASTATSGDISSKASWGIMASALGAAIVVGGLTL
ncbi:hypothetical protein HKX48_007464 [Thoreauomyces humboldtii]|nr:hypothetical protein HKX48_007464 [Thoreauomyces humboldtii]